MAIFSSKTLSSVWRRWVHDRMDPTSATSGQVLTADGAGGASYQDAATGGGGTGTIEPGMSMLWWTPTPPTNWIHLNGQALEVAVYTDLFAVWGYSFGGSGDFFNAPDTRGEFIRGWNDGSGNDPDAASRTDRGDGTTGDNLGTKQDHALEDHQHLSEGFSSGLGGGGSPIQFNSTAGVINRGVRQVQALAGLTVNTSTESRGRNIQGMWIAYVGTTTSAPSSGDDMWDLISTTAISGDPANVDLTWNESTYSDVRIVLDAVQPATDGVTFRLRLGDTDGTVIHASTNDYDGVTQIWEGTGAFSAISGTDTVDLATSSSNAANETISGTIKVIGGANSDGGAAVKATIHYTNSTSNQRTIETKAFLDDNTQAAVDTVRLYFAAGNFANTGNIKLYGLRKTV